MNAPLAANNYLKDNYNTDFVALGQLIQGTILSVRQIRLLGVLGDAYISVRRGVKYIVFRGRAGLRPNLQGTRYLRANPVVSAFIVGTEEIVKDATKATRIAFIAYVAIDIVTEIMSEDRFSLARLGVAIVSDIVQCAIGTAVTVGAVVLLTSFGTPVVAAFVLGVGLALFVGSRITGLDKQYGLTDKAQKRMMAYEKKFLQRWDARQRAAVAELREGAYQALRLVEEVALQVAKDAALSIARELVDRILPIDEALPQQLLPSLPRIRL